jgi:FMN reductase
MMRRPCVLGIAGSVRRPSRTSSLVAEVLEAHGKRLGTRGRLVELGGQGASFLDTLTRDAARGAALEVVEAIEDADVLVVGTPVYRASYTGLFKHVFDLVHHEALVGKTVVLTATGGSPLHGLVMEHQLRPLFGFFRAHTVPSAVYATEADFDRYELASVQVRERVERAADEAARLASGPDPLASTSWPAPAPAAA